MTSARCFKLVIAYDGASFSGWQRQRGLRTVQGEIEAVLARIEGRDVSVAGAGRTDAGVHAAGQVASVRLTAAISPSNLQRALNATLTDDVRVLAVEECPLEFNARIYARLKTYRYWIWNGRIVPPLLRGTTWHVRHPLDIAAMASAAPLFEGTHDFVALQAQGARVKTTTRTLIRSRIAPMPIADWPGLVPDTGALLQYETSGTGYLRHMVRTMIGTLVDVGRGHRTVEDVRALLETGNRTRAGRTAPPHGLVLWSVDYDSLTS